MDNKTDKSTNKDENSNDILDEKEKEVKEDKTKDKKLFLSKLFTKQKKKEKKFDEDEKIDCISKVIGKLGFFLLKKYVWSLVGFVGQLRSGLRLHCVTTI